MGALGTGGCIALTMPSHRPIACPWPPQRTDAGRGEWQSFDRYYKSLIKVFGRGRVPNTYGVRNTRKRA